MKTQKKIQLYAGILSAFALASVASGAVTLVQGWEFNTSGDEEGWTASTQVTGLTQATASGTGGEGILTASDITGTDPQLTYAPDITLPVGQTWDSIVFRFRQLSANGGPSTSFLNSGTTFVQNGTGPSGLFVTGSYSPAGGLYAGETFNTTLTSDGPGDWQIYTVSFTSATTFNSGDITSLRFDPVGNDAAKNFEVDYIRLYAVPEPSAALLGGLGLLALLRRRR